MSMVMIRKTQSPFLMRSLFILLTMIFWHGTIMGKTLDDKPLVKIKSPRIRELSGIIRASHSGEYWGISDRGNTPDLYRFNLQGRVLQQVRLQGIRNFDWEAITRDAEGNLYIGDFGDNHHIRREYTIYRFPEPLPSTKQITTFKTCVFQYSDGKSHNCESFFVAHQKMYLVTKKDDKDDEPVLFCLTAFKQNGKNIAQRIGTLNIRGDTTDTTYSEERNILSVLTYSRLYFFEHFFSEKIPSLLSNKLTKSIKIDFNQCEGICFDEDLLIITNEDGELWKYPIQRFVQTGLNHSKKQVK